MEITDFQKSSRYLGWIILAAIYLLLDFAVVGTNRWDFLYGIVYAEMFFAIAVIMLVQKPNLIAASMAALMSVFVVLVSDGQIPVSPAFYLISVLFLLLLLTQILNMPKTSFGASKYMLFVPFFMLIAYYISGFAIRLNGVGYTANWLLTRLGITVLSFDGIIKLLGVKRKWLMWLTAIGLLLAVLGATYWTVGLGYGLNLLQ